MGRRARIWHQSSPYSSSWFRSSAMRSIAEEAESCSQYRRTSHPAFWRMASSCRSRSTFRESFVPQYSEFIPSGRRPCWGQRCQKQPSTKMATLSLVKTMSGLGRRSDPTSIGKSLRKRYPRACRPRRRASSGCVSVRRLLRIEALTPADVAGSKLGCAIRRQ